MATTPELPSELDARLSDPATLIPVIVQEVDSDEVLMLAWMNKAALLATMATGAATYWSRSRSELWVKGASSGNTQQVESIELDCDSDALLMRVKQKGVACHTGARTCFGKRLS
jgi:phosphoribosyl-AMP cyclohydrolase